MTAEDLESLAHVREVASAWIYVAGGAFLIAISQTWGLREAYGWPTWAFWAALAVMMGLLTIRTVLRMRRPLVPRTSTPANN
jgi:TRAP-type C4-dicarboxylate transport system permease small subunit